MASNSHADFPLLTNLIDHGLARKVELRQKLHYDCCLFKLLDFRIDQVPQLDAIKPSFILVFQCVHHHSFPIIICHHLDSFQLRSRVRIRCALPVFTRCIINLLVSWLEDTVLFLLWVCLEWYSDVALRISLAFILMIIYWFLMFDAFFVEMEPSQQARRSSSLSLFANIVEVVHS